MKRLLAIAIAFGMFSVVGFSGCGEEAKTTTETKVETPKGTDTVKDTKSETKTGDMK